MNLTGLKVLTKNGAFILLLLSREKVEQSIREWEEGKFAGKRFSGTCPAGGITRFSVVGDDITMMHNVRLTQQELRQLCGEWPAETPGHIPPGASGWQGN